MPILALTMQKGGVGKTTSTLAIGVELARMGRRVLLVDVDPQSNLTMIAGHDPVTIGRSITDVLVERIGYIHEAILHTAHGVDLLPATLALAGAEPILSGRIGRELLLRGALDEIRERYDYILIDSPPNLGLFTLNVLTAAEAVLVPLQAHVLALKALPQLEQTIQLIRQLNPRLRIGGIIVTMVDRRTMVNQEVEDAVRQQYGDLVFEAVVPFTVRLVEAPAAAQPIVDIADHVPTDAAPLDVTRIAAALQETGLNALAQIHRIITTLGLEAAESFMNEALRIETEGGMRLPDGSGRRTVGGLFFLLVTLRAG